MVSGTISLPSLGFFSPFPRGTSSLSVAKEYLALPDGPGRFRQDCTCPALLGYPARPPPVFAYATITLFGAPFQVLPLTGKGPTADPQPRCHLRDIGLGCSRFARHYSGNHSLFSFPQGTEMFHFPWFAPSALCIQAEVMRLSSHGVSPFGHLRLNVWLATPRSFSQPPTSFFASWHLGIHRTPLVAYLP